MRSRVVQFSELFITQAMALMPELAGSAACWSAAGAGCSSARSRLRGAMLAELVQARGPRRLEIFIGVIGALARAGISRLLASAAYLPDPSRFMSTGMNEALAYISDNLTEPFREADLAAIAGLSPGAFSRSFRRHTGLALVQYVSRLRVNLACQMLMGDTRTPITDVCFNAGFNNLSNFNRQFLRQKDMAPSRFRALLAEHERGPGPGAKDCCASRPERRGGPGRREPPARRTGTAQAVRKQEKRKNSGGT